MVRDVRLWCRKSSEGLKIAPTFHHLMTKNSVNPAVMGIFFELGKDKCSKKEEMGSAFHLKYF